MELKIPPVVQVIVAGIAMWLIAYLLPQANLNFSGIAWLAGIFYGAGVVIALSGVLAFRQANTTVDPRTPDKTSSLVTQGIYNFTRNPMYLGFLLLLIGFALYLANVLAAFILPAFVLFMNRYQIKPEERFMQAKFGTEYQSYKEQVRRWI